MPKNRSTAEGYAGIKDDFERRKRRLMRVDINKYGFKQTFNLNVYWKKYT